jgi:hypothetical protein
MAFALGLQMPLTAAQQVSVTTTAPPAAEWRPEQVVQEMSPWRGLVAVKKGSANLVDKFTTLKYFWDLSKCSRASTAIKSMIDLYTGNLNSLGLDNSTKLKYTTILSNAKEEQSTLEPDVIISELPSEGDSSKGTDTDCSSPPFTMGQDLCTDLQDEATEIADSALTTQKATLSAAVLRILNVVDKFSMAKSQLQNFLAKFQHKEVPADLTSTFKCALRKGTCKSEKTPVVLPLAASKVESNNTSGLQLQVATSCPDNVTNAGQYQLVALPYQEGEHLKQLVLQNESASVWVTSHQKSFTHKPICQGTGSGTVCIPSSDLTQPTVARIRYSGTPSWMYVPVSHNELIMYTKQATGRLECTVKSQNANYTMTGTYRMYIPEMCSFYITVNGKQHQLLPRGLPPSSSSALPLIIPLTTDMVPVQLKSIISEYPYAILWDHFSVNWPYYLLAPVLTFLIVFLCLVLCSIMRGARHSLRTISHAQRFSRPRREVQQKRVYIRNPLLL